MQSFIVYFVLGYLFYAALLCGIGSLANNLKEAQTLMMPIQLLLIVPLVVMMPIGRDPNGLLAQVLSWLPPFTPFVMMNRAAFPPGLYHVRRNDVVDGDIDLLRAATAPRASSKPAC